MATTPVPPVPAATPGPTQADIEAALKRAQDAEAATKASQRELEVTKAREAALRRRTAQAATADPKATDDDLRAQLEEATRRNLVLETATAFGLKPEDLEGEFQSPEEIRLRAQTVVLQHELTRLKEAADADRKSLADVVASVKATGEAATAGTSTEGALTQTPTPREVQRSDALAKDYEDAVKAARQGRTDRTNEGLLRWLTVAHRDPTKVIGRGEAPEE